MAQAKASITYNPAAFAVGPGNKSGFKDSFARQIEKQFDLVQGDFSVEFHHGGNPKSTEVLVEISGVNRPNDPQALGPLESSVQQFFNLLAHGRNKATIVVHFENDPKPLVTPATA